MDWKSLNRKVHSELQNHVIPFWVDHSIDFKNGGYYTCLLGNGEVFDTDKFVWLQARQIWMFAKLYEDDRQQTKWLDIANHGAQFLMKHGRDTNGQWYFALDEKGAPLVKPYNIFSDCFACLAFGQLYKVTDEKDFLEVAQQAFNNIVTRQPNPKGPYEKRIGESRPLKNFALPMILANLVFEVGDLFDLEQQNIIDECIQTVMNDFYDDDLNVILENVDHDNRFHDSMDGRLINPGHAIEAMSFIMDLGKLKEDQELVKTACNRTMRMLELGWDIQYGGIFYFLDALNHPLQQLEWDQKLWWVHLEASVALLKGYHLTQDQALLNRFQLVFDYTWTHFRDTNKGEWFGYLKRDGSRLLELKGGKWKGCFHVPRSLRLLELITKEMI